MECFLELQELFTWSFILNCLFIFMHHVASIPQLRRTQARLLTPTKGYTQLPRNRPNNNTNTIHALSISLALPI